MSSDDRPIHSIWKKITPFKHALNPPGVQFLKVKELWVTIAPKTKELRFLLSGFRTLYLSLLNSSIMPSTVLFVSTSLSLRQFRLG
jgi:hypothetical protein